MAVYILAQTYVVQTWLADFATNYLSKELKTRIHIDKVKIRFVKSVELQGFYVQDLHKDTLLYASKLTIDINQFSIPQHIIDIAKVKLTDSKFFLTRYHGEDYDNLQFIADYFASKDTLKPAAPWKIVLTNVEFANVTFRHIVQDDTANLRGIDFSHLDIKNIYGNFKTVHFDNDSIFTYIHNLRFDDKSGFNLAELTGDAKVSSKEIRLKDLILRTPQTDIRTNLSFQYDSFPDFGDFLKKIHFNSSFKNSTVSFDDIAYFATDLWHFNRSLKLSGDFKGTVSKFRGKNVTIEYGRDTRFIGNLGLTGLPNIEETYFDVMAEEITSSREDIEKVPLAPYDKGNHVRLPDRLAAAGKVTFKGKFTGFYNDFVAYGNISSALGYLSSDMNLKYDSLQKKEFYSGHLSANNFEVGRLLNAKDLGNTSFNVDIKGSGLKLDNADTKMKGVVSVLQFKNYSYRNINVDGEISKKLFSGAVDVDEENVALSFKGQINFKDTLPQYNFTADIEHLHVDTLNLMKVPGEAEISTQLKMNLKGNKLENMQGQIQIDSFNYKADKVLYHINNITVTSDVNGSTQALHLASDNVDADFNGHIIYSSLGDAFRGVLPQYFPALSHPASDIITHQDFTFDIRFKNMDLITERFLPDWRIAPNTTANGKFVTGDNMIEFNFFSPQIQFKNYRLYDEKLSLNTERESVNLHSFATQLYYSDSSYIAAPVLSATGKNNVVDFTLQLADTSNYPNRGFFKANLAFLSPSKFNLKFDDANVTINNREWSISKDNSISFDTSAIALHNLTFSSDSQLISADGIISKRAGDKMGFGFVNFSLQNFNHLFQTDNVSVAGIMNGTASVTNALLKPQLLSDLSINGFTFNGDSMGNATISSEYESESKAVKVNIAFTKRNAKIISIVGQYYTAKEKNNLDFDIQLRNIYLPPFEKYVNTVVSNMQGKISADLQLTGTLKKPVLEGTLDFSKSSCRVNYLNTVYNLNDRVVIGENYFELKDFSLVDTRGNKAFAEGRINHNYFKDFSFDIAIHTEKFQALNTTIVQNELYYGTAYVSGTAGFRGPPENIVMDMHLKSEKGTDIHIPLSNTEEVSHGEFVTFRKNKTDPNEYIAPKVSTSGITMNMYLEITPEATVEIVFDEKIGDKITGNGNSNLQLIIDHINGFQIFGDFTISRGTYLFTLQNIINKKFVIDQGSRISWNGSPYDAEVALTAAYTGSTSTLYKLMDDSTFRRRLNYEVQLNLTNKLMNPTINYTINVLGLDANDESRVSSRLHIEDEISRQVFGLLVLNQFLPSAQGVQSTYAIEAGSGASSSAGELLSNQVSNWLSQISHNVGLGFNYKPRDTYSKEEIELIFNKSFLNDRLLVEGNVGVASDQTSSNLVGDFNLEYLVSKDGRLRLKTYNHSNTNNLLDYNSPYTQGVGVVYREQFDTWKQLLQKYKLMKKDKPAENP
jgi:hypothetical protein